jgi:hypothetical protein
LGKAYGVIGNMLGNTLRTKKIQNIQHTPPPPPPKAYLWWSYCPVVLKGGKFLLFCTPKKKKVENISEYFSVEYY